MKDPHSDLSGVIHFTGAMILILAFSNLLWYARLNSKIVVLMYNIEDTNHLPIHAKVPLSIKFGRRNVVLLSLSLLCIGSYCWKATATTYSSFIGAAALTGIAAGPTMVCASKHLTTTATCSPSTGDTANSHRGCHVPTGEGILQHLLLPFLLCRRICM